VEEPAKYTSPDWTKMYRLELGVDPSDRHQLLTAVTKDIAAAHQGDTAARRRVSAYCRAQRAFRGRSQIRSAKLLRRTTLQTRTKAKSVKLQYKRRRLGVWTED
jgi:hypothetical protein